MIIILYRDFVLFFVPIFVTILVLLLFILFLVYGSFIPEYS